ncbi:phage tail tip lysozyme, partial [Lacticaseibacillus paracasei]
NNIKQAVQFFFRNGFKDYQIAALVGGFIQESKMEPSIINGIGAVGIVQWLDYTNPKTGKKSLRKTKLKQKSNWQSLEVQLNYVIEEFN